MVIIIVIIILMIMIMMIIIILMVLPDPAHDDHAHDDDNHWGRASSLSVPSSDKRGQKVGTSKEGDRIKIIFITINNLASSVHAIALQNLKLSTDPLTDHQKCTQE